MRKSAQSLFGVSCEGRLLVLLTEPEEEEDVGRGV